MFGILTFSCSDHWQKLRQRCFFQWDPACNTRFLGPSESISEHDRVMRLCWAHAAWSLNFTMGCPFPTTKLPRIIGRSATPINAFFLGAHLSPHLNDMSIGSAVFAQLTSVSNRQTDTQTHTDRPRYICSSRRSNNSSSSERCVGCCRVFGSRVRWLS